ncbi:MAG: hypothetical protein M1820_004137 [Bogoriella megaspora]|nr:MAG: hypothetical protein M1820_004137 [Bogoriella megaspora]
MIFVLGSLAFFASLNNTILILRSLSTPASATAAESDDAAASQGESLSSLSFPIVEVGVGLIACNLPSFGGSQIIQSLPHKVRHARDSMTEALNHPIRDDCAPTTPPMSHSTKDWTIDTVNELTSIYFIAFCNMVGSNKLRIAISGGGLAGAALANILFRQDHLEVQLFESAPEFSERGQAISVAINAQHALARVVPDAEDLLKRAGAVPMHSTRLLMGNGPAAGAKVIDLAEEHPGRIVHRAAFLRELLAPLPRENMHTNKKLVAVEKAQENSLLLRFANGSTAEVDALIGADGLFGFVRSHVLGADHEAVEPVAAGWAAVHNLVPFAKARDKLGAHLFDQDRQYGWIGDGGLMMHDVLSNGETVQCVGAFVDHNPSKDRKKPCDCTHLESAFAGWLNGPVAKGMIDLLLDQDEPAAYAQWEHRDAPTYAKDRVCVMGDSAHAMTPWQGSGGAIALEDAVVLGALFAQIRSADQIEGALKAYDAVRRPRAQPIAASSRLTGCIMTGLVEELGTDPIKMHDALKDRWNFIHDFDLGKHVADAIAML